MKVIETPIKGLFVLEPRVFEDSRGYFFESYSAQTLKKAGLEAVFVQDNQSRSTLGVIRGLHFQLQPYAQTKLVRAVEGTIFDVAVDIRKNSPTFGKWYGVELSAANKKQLWIPKGFAHGFSVLSNFATVFYKCDDYYKPEAERGIVINDPELNIHWQMPVENAIISERDTKNKLFSDVENSFVYAENE